MTDLAEVLDGPEGKRGGLREEVARAVMAINRARFASKKFNYHEVSKTTAPLPGIARVFQITFDDPEPIGIGSNVDRSMLIATVSIWYPEGEEWATARKSDYWRIVRALIADQTFASADTAQRYVDVKEKPIEEPTIGGYWYRIPVRCIVHHT